MRKIYWNDPENEEFEAQGDEGRALRPRDFENLEVALDETDVSAEPEQKEIDEDFGVEDEYDEETVDLVLEARFVEGLWKTFSLAKLNTIFKQLEPEDRVRFEFARVQQENFLHANATALKAQKERAIALAKERVEAKRKHKVWVAQREQALMEERVQGLRDRKRHFAPVSEVKVAVAVVTRAAPQEVIMCKGKALKRVPAHRVKAEASNGWIRYQGVSNVC
jgi:hypothetical protein